MNENKIIKLFTDGQVSTNDGRKFTRLLGGFNENSPIITTKQIAELLDKKVIHVNEVINRNIDYFINEEGYIKDLKVIALNDNNLKVLKSLGYTSMEISKAKNIYILSHEGFVKYMQISDISHDYSYFEKSYFGEIKGRYSIIRYEQNFKDLLLRIFKDICNFIPQYLCCDNKYRIDFYFPKLNLAVEYDEEKHKFYKQEDKNRETEILNELKCHFIRVIKGRELEGINEIFKHILGK